MRIQTKLFFVLVVMSLLVALLGTLAVLRQRTSSTIAAAKEAEHVAQVLSFFMSDPAAPPASIQEIVDKLHRTERRDVVLMDAEKRILADADPKDVGRIYDWDRGNEGGLTIRDRQVRTFIEKGVDHPAGIMQIVVPIEAASGQVIGAVVLEYTPLNEEMMRLTVATVHEVALIGFASAGIALLLALYVGRSVGVPLRQLTKAATGFAAGQTDLPLPAPRNDEIGELTKAFNDMVRKRQVTEDALRSARDDFEARVLDRTAELRHSNDTLQMQARVIEHMTEGVMVADEAGRVVSTNPAADAMFGYERGELIGLNASELRDLDETEARKVIAELIATLPCGSGWSGEVNRRRKDGSSFLTRAEIRAFEIGGRCHFFTVQEDITERKRIEQALSESELRYRTLVEATTAIVWDTPATGGFDKAQPSWEAFTGQTLTEYLGWGWLDAIHPEDRAETARVYSAAVADRSLYKVEHRLRFHDQTYREMTVRAAPIIAEDGTIQQWIGIHTDITEQKSTERSLRLLSAAVEQSKESILITDAELDQPGPRILFVNQAFMEMTGYAAADVLGATPRLLQGLRTNRAVVQRLRENLARGETFAGETVNYRKDGTAFDMEWQIAPLRDGGGPPTHFVAIQRDISERKQAEAERLELSQQLMDASRRAGMAEVATSVLHNVGNVLNSVNISATLASEKIRRSCRSDVARLAAMLQEHAADLPDFLSSPKGSQLPAFLTQVAEHLAEEQRAVLSELEAVTVDIDHIKEIVAMQQTYARIAGVLEELSLASLVDDALRMNAAALSRHQVEVVCDYAEMPALAVDKHKVLQILINLIRNAKYAIDEAGAPGKRMTLRTRCGADSFASISVCDEGVGIPAENLTRIFEHGFTTRTEGHGFGLHSAALAAREMGGSLTAQSAGVGYGATFTLALPMTQPRGQS